MGFGLRRGIISSGVLGTTPTFAADTDITDFNASLTHIYELEESSGVLVDQVGSLNSTSTVSGDYSTTTGKYNEAVSHSTTTAGLTYPSAFLDFSQNFAVSLWVQHDATAAFGNIVCQYDIGVGLNYRIGIRPSDGLCDFTMQNNSPSSFVISSVVASASGSGAYHHIVATRQTNTMQLWVNGVSIGTATFSGTEGTTDTTRLFSRNTGSESEVLKADLDETYFWEGLTFGSGKPTEAAFVAALYNSGTGTFWSEES